jgi:signal transduction histidine kinase/CheY-like chemotaxis protein
VTLESQVLAQAPAGLLCFADDGLVRYANSALHAWLERSDGTLAGTRVDAMLSPASRVFHSTHFFPLLRLHGVAEEVHLTLRTAAGGDVPVLASAARSAADGEALNYCALITMRRRKEFEAALVDARRQAEEAAAARDQFLAVVSHELRNPLSAITGWIHVLRSGKADAAMTARALETIERNAQVQVQLIEDLLDVSRVVTGKMRISPRPHNLAPIVEATLDNARPSALAKDVDLVATIESDAGIVQADRVRVQQIVWNLVSNAVKFTPRRGRVQVVLARAGSRVQLSVADTGIGIAADKVPYVFDRFWQASAGGQRESTGLGLGLSICRSLVELHGGAIRAESAGPGRGATFIVEFPIAVAAATDASAGSSAPPTGAASLEGLDVLVVDDDDDARGLLRMLLSGVGARVTTAQSAEEAMDCIKRAPPAIVLSDIGMPGKDGYALVRELRAMRGHEAIAAIAITGLHRPQDRIDLLRAGYQAHLVKPVDPDEVVALVRALARR